MLNQAKERLSHYKKEVDFIVFIAIIRAIEIDREIYQWYKTTIAFALLSNLRKDKGTYIFVIIFLIALFIKLENDSKAYEDFYAQQNFISGTNPEYDLKVDDVANNVYGSADLLENIEQVIQLNTVESGAQHEIVVNGRTFILNLIRVNDEGGGCERFSGPHTYLCDARINNDGSIEVDIQTSIDFGNILDIYDQGASDILLYTTEIHENSHVYQFLLQLAKLCNDLGINDEDDQGELDQIVESLQRHEDIDVEVQPYIIDTAAKVFLFRSNVFVEETYHESGLKVASFLYEGEDGKRYILLNEVDARSFVMYAYVLRVVQENNFESYNDLLDYLFADHANSDGIWQTEFHDDFVRYSELGYVPVEGDPDNSVHPSLPSGRNYMLGN